MLSEETEGLRASYESGPKGIPERRRSSTGGGAGLTDLRLMVCCRGSGLRLGNGLGSRRIGGLGE